MREYDITYVAKEYLIRNGWAIIAYNPPGSQGTFTIPNPNKDHAYRGQNGSISPDIVAYKSSNNENIFYIVEAKPFYNSEDVMKMIMMFSDQERLCIFLDIISGYAAANNILFDKKQKIVIRFAKAHSGLANPVESVDTILIEQIDQDWDAEDINPYEDIYSKFKVEVIRAS